MSVGGGLERFPVGNSSYFRFHKQLIFNEVVCSEFSCFCKKNFKKFKTMMTENFKLA
jgi:hypothetical protein